MKIKNIKINGFGKLKDKEVNLSNGINVVYGHNESGKSSLLKFISSMLYGAGKNKNGKDISDFDKFKPWRSEEFSGRLEYSLDDGKNYEVFREFKKKMPIIYNSNKEDISKSFKIEKAKGIDFFYEQTGIDEETFYNTAISEQEGIRLSKSSQNAIIQKISNLVSSGDDSVSYKKTMDKISKNQTTNVGTEKTFQRPINLIDSKIKKLLNEKKDLEIFKENIYDNSLEKEQLRLEEKDEEIKKTFLKEVKAKQDSNRLKSAEINFNKNLENEYTQKIEELNKKIVNNDIDNKIDKIDFKKYYIMIAIIFILYAVLMFINSFKLINAIILLPIIFVLYIKNKAVNQIKNNEKNRDYSEEKIVNEIDVLKQNRESQRKEAEEKNLKLEKEIEKEKEDLTSKYIQYLDIGFINSCFEKSYDELLKEIDLKDNRINTIKFKLHAMETNENDINMKLESLAKIEENLEALEEEKDELLSLNRSYDIAKECLNLAYSEVKENISPIFTKNLCDIISKISNGRYTNISVNDTDGLIVEVDNGSYIPASRLSTGTIDQMYISMRLSALNEISKESLPIILDEAFAYFDDERLENILKYLNDNFKDNQIIIFTCSKREESILEKLKIPYLLTNI